MNVKTVFVFVCFVILAILPYYECFKDREGGPRGFMNIKECKSYMKGLQDQIKDTMGDGSNECMNKVYEEFEEGKKKCWEDVMKTAKSNAEPASEECKTAAMDFFDIKKECV